MLNPSSLYEFHQAPDPNRPGVLLVGVEGYMDAGHTVKLLADHLLETSEPEHLVSFDIDQLFDYRGRRPSVVFDTNRFEDLHRPHLDLYRMTDRDGHTYYLLRGAEPDFQWERVTAAVMELVRTYGVTETVAWHGIPMAVPHTRPIGYTLTATDQSLIGNPESPFGRVLIPSSFSQMLQVRLGEAGRNAVGVVVHVPHYLSDNDFPEAALVALNAIQDAADLNLPNDALVAAVGDSRKAIADAVAENPQVGEIVKAVEAQYDEIVRNREIHGITGPQPDLPSADELGAEFEAFLNSIGDQGTGFSDRPNPQGPAGPTPNAGDPRTDGPDHGTSGDPGPDGPDQQWS